MSENNDQLTYRFVFANDSRIMDPTVPVPPMTSTRGLKVEDMFYTAARRWSSCWINKSVASYILIIHVAHVQRDYEARSESTATALTWPSSLREHLNPGINTGTTRSRGLPEVCQRFTVTTLMGYFYAEQHTNPEFNIVRLIPVCQSDPIPSRKYFCHE